MDRLSWVIPVNSKSNLEFLIQLGRGRVEYTEGGKDWVGAIYKSSKAGSHHNLREARNRFPYQPPERGQPFQHLDFGSAKNDFRFVASRNWERIIFFPGVLRDQVCAIC